MASIDSVSRRDHRAAEKRDKSSNMYKVAIVTKVNPIAFDVFLTETLQQEPREAALVATLERCLSYE